MTPAPDNAPYGDERLFTAAEVQATIAAVILYERATSERRLRTARSAFDELIRQNRRALHERHYFTLDEINRRAR